jgi:hypothetical protein
MFYFFCVALCHAALQARALLSPAEECCYLHNVTTNIIIYLRFCVSGFLCVI